MGPGWELPQLRDWHYQRPPQAAARTQGVSAGWTLAAPGDWHGGGHFSPPSGPDRSWSGPTWSTWQRTLLPEAFLLAFCTSLHPHAQVPVGTRHFGLWQRRSHARNIGNQCPSCRKPVLARRWKQLIDHRATIFFF